MFGHNDSPTEKPLSTATSASLHTLSAAGTRHPHRTPERQLLDPEKSRKGTQAEREQARDEKSREREKGEKGKERARSDVHSADGMPIAPRASYGKTTCTQPSCRMGSPSIKQVKGEPAGSALVTDCSGGT